MYSEAEVSIVSTLVGQNSSCSGEAGIGGSTNEAVGSQFAFSNAYSRGTSSK